MGYDSNDYKAGYAAGVREERNRKDNSNYKKLLDELHEVYYDLRDIVPKNERAMKRLLDICERNLNKK